MVKIAEYKRTSREEWKLKTAEARKYGTASVEDARDDEG